MIKEKYYTCTPFHETSGVSRAGDVALDEDDELDELIIKLAATAADTPPLWSDETEF